MAVDIVALVPSTMSDMAALPDAQADSELADLYHAIGRAIGHIHGLTIEHIEIDDREPDGRPSRLKIEINGWSPSLHKAEMAWVVHLRNVIADTDIRGDIAGTDGGGDSTDERGNAGCRDGAPATGTAGATLNDDAAIQAAFTTGAVTVAATGDVIPLADHLDVQARRAECARTLGGSAPGIIQNTGNIAHLTIDRSVLPIIAEAYMKGIRAPRTGRDNSSDDRGRSDQTIPITDVREALYLGLSDIRETARLIHQHAIDYDGSPALHHIAECQDGGPDDVISTIVDEGVTSHLIVAIDGPNRKDGGPQDQPGSPGLHLTDNILTIPGEVPATIIASAIGRTVAEVITLPGAYHHVLWDRTITAAASTTIWDTALAGPVPAMRLTLSADRVRIGDLIRVVNTDERASWHRSSDRQPGFDLGETAP